MEIESFYCLPGRLFTYKQCRRCFEAYEADRDKCPRCYPAESTATAKAEAFGIAIEDSTPHPSGEGYSVRVRVQRPAPPDIQMLREDQDPDTLNPGYRSRIYWAWHMVQNMLTRFCK